MIKFYQSISNYFNNIMQLKIIIRLLLFTAIALACMVCYSVQIMRLRICSENVISVRACLF